VKQQVGYNSLTTAKKDRLGNKTPEHVGMEDVTWAELGAMLII